MGFFKKIFKGIGKVFKKIGKGIKKAFKKFGKFMGKIGVLGQVAMMFILPGVGQLLGKAWSAIAGQTAGQAAASTVGQMAADAAVKTGADAVASTAAGASAEKAALSIIKDAGAKGATDAAKTLASDLIKNTGAKATGLMAKEGLAKGIGQVMQFTGKVVGTPGKVFSSITQGVTDTLGNFAKTASNNIFGTNFTTAAGDTLSGKFFSGGDSAFGRSFGKTSKFQNILTKAPTAQTLEAVDSYKSTLDALNNVSGADLIPTTSSKFDTPVGMEPRVSGVRPFNANDINLTADTTNSMLGQPTNLSPEAQQLYKETSNLGYEEGQVGDMLKKGPKGADSLLASPVEKESILSRLGDVFGDTVEGIKKAPSDVMDKVENFTADPVGKTGEFLFGGTKEAVRQGVNNQLLQGIGLVEKPVAPVYETTNTYVAPFETTTPQMFEAPETMSPMAFAQNVTNNPSPYGYTAFQYNQYMNRTAAA